MNRSLLLAASLAASLAALAHPVLAQQSIIQGGGWNAGHALMYSQSGNGQPVAQDSGPASGGAAGSGLSELQITSRGISGQAPYANTGTGPLNAHACLYDGPTTGAYHFLCLDPNAQGGGLLAYGYGGGASALPLQFSINGSIVSIPTGGYITGPGSATAGHLATWGTYPEILDGGAVPSVVPGTAISVVGGPAYTISVTNPYMTIGGQTINLGGTSLNQGNGPKLQLSAGSTGTGHCVEFDAAGNTVDAGGACNTSGASGVVNPATANQLAYYATTGAAVSGLTTVNNAILVTNGSGVPSESTTAPSGLTIPAPNVTTSFSYGGNAITFPTLAATLTYMSGSFTNGDCLKASGTAGAIADSGVTCGGGITVGTTSVGSGTNGALLYDNAGTLGNYTPAALSSNLCQPNFQVFTATGTYTTPTCNGVTANWLWVMERGGGGSGGIVSGSSCTTGTGGGVSAFNSVQAGAGASGGATSAPGAGGSSGVGTAFRQPGAVGQMGWSNGTVFIGGSGGGDGGAGGQNGGGANAAANSGAGGGGQGSNTNSLSCSGGGQGELAEFLITSPSSSYTATVGAGGTGGSGNGGSGQVAVLAGWQ